MRRRHAVQEQQRLVVQQGVWIDAQWIREAGLGPQLRVLIGPGEIRILPATENVELPDKAAKGWDVFRRMGEDAPIGRLADAAAEHDKYLYEKEQ
jgi:hypothetical protein